MADRGPRAAAPDTSPSKAGKTGKTRKTPDKAVTPDAPTPAKKKPKPKSQQKPEHKVARRPAAEVARASQEVTVSTLTTPETATTEPDTIEAGAPEAAFSAERPAADRTPQEGTAEGDGGSMFGPGATPQAGRIPVLAVTPQVDGGRWPAKAVVGEQVPVTATVFREGHDAVAASAVLVDPDGKVHQRVRMTPGAARHGRLERHADPGPRRPLDVLRRGLGRPLRHLGPRRHDQGERRRRRRPHARGGRPAASSACSSRPPTPPSTPPRCRTPSPRCATPAGRPRRGSPPGAAPPSWPSSPPSPSASS